MQFSRIPTTRQPFMKRIGGVLVPSLLVTLVMPVAAQKRAITIDDYLALKSVGNPQVSPDGKWVAYTVTEQSLKDNRGITRIWLADVASGSARQLTAGPGSDRQPRWSPDGRTLAFVSTRENGAQLWVLPVVGGEGEARRVTSLSDGVSDPLWLPNGAGLVVTSDVKWPAQQEIDRRNGDFPTDARLWTGLLWRHWDDWRAGTRAPGPGAAPGRAPPGGRGGEQGTPARGGGREGQHESREERRKMGVI